MMKNFIGKKEKRTNKGTDKNMWLILCYTVQLVISSLCNKFNNPKPSSCREIFDGRCPCALQTRERRKKKKIRKECKINISTFSFFNKV